jgi:hypothetical protein
LVTAGFPREVLWIVYIRAHEEQKVSGIAAGTYLVRFAMGRDWEGATGRFLAAAQFHQSGTQFEFIETEATEDRPGEYHEMLLGLDQVIGGNLLRLDISERQFNEGEVKK